MENKEIINELKVAYGMELDHIRKAFEGEFHSLISDSLREIGRISLQSRRRQLWPGNLETGGHGYPG